MDVGVDTSLDSMTLEGYDLRLLFWNDFFLSALDGTALACFATVRGTILRTF
jgi:hypothetical protein